MPKQRCAGSGEPIAKTIRSPAPGARARVRLRMAVSSGFMADSDLCLALAAAIRAAAAAGASRRIFSAAARALAAAFLGVARPPLAALCCDMAVDVARERGVDPAARRRRRRLPTRASAGAMTGTFLPRM